MTLQKITDSYKRLFYLFGLNSYSGKEHAFSPQAAVHFARENV